MLVIPSSSFVSFTMSKPCSVLPLRSTCPSVVPAFALYFSLPLKLGAPRRHRSLLEQVRPVVHEDIPSVTTVLQRCYRGVTMLCDADPVLSDAVPVMWNAAVLCKEGEGTTALQLRCRRARQGSNHPSHEGTHRPIVSEWCYEWLNGVIIALRLRFN
jgi:hypothetical protein